jgi:hypothetical protein
MNRRSSRSSPEIGVIRSPILLPCEYDGRRRIRNVCSSPAGHLGLQFLSSQPESVMPLWIYSILLFDMFT